VSPEERALRVHALRHGVGSSSRLVASAPLLARARRGASGSSPSSRRSAAFSDTASSSEGVHIPSQEVIHRLQTVLSTRDQPRALRLVFILRSVWKLRRASRSTTEPLERSDLASGQLARFSQNLYGTARVPDYEAGIGR
jgi:hypothetical protein